MTLQLSGCAIALVLGAVLVGAALDRLGLRCGPAAPAVGLAVLIVVAGFAIQLPGRATTAAVLTLAVIVAAAAALAVRMGRAPRSAERPWYRSALAPGAAAVIAAAGASIPFLANGRVGLLGVSLDNDTANHLQWAEALRTPSVGGRYGLPSGYPLGPHSLVDAVATGLGARLDLAFSGLLVAAVILLAIVGAGTLAGESAWKGVLAGAAASLLYLVAAYVGEGAFKEPLMALFLLATVLELERLPATGTGRFARATLLVPLALLVAGELYVYSYLGLTWTALTVLLWLLAEGAARLRGPRGTWRPSRGAVRATAIAAGLAGLVLVVVIAPTLGRITSFAGSLGASPAASGAIGTTNIGNLAHALSPYEALGIWNYPDFRFSPANVFHAGEFAGFALAVLLGGVLVSLARREFALPAALAACAIVYWRSSHGQSAYVTAKTLSVAGPVVAVAAARGLLRTPLRPLDPLWRFARLAVLAVWIAMAAHSSYEVLRSSPVWPTESTDELLTLARQTRDRDVLFLGSSDYASWLFSGSFMSTLAINSVSMEQATPRPGKPNAYGTAFDFDSVNPTTINRFAFFVTPASDYASAAPAGVELVRRLPMYELWHRTGFIAPRAVLEPVGAPAGPLDCRTPAGRALAHRRGVAAIVTPPVVVGLNALAPGATERTKIRLPSGQWELSLQYESALDLDVSAGRRRWRMPAYLDRPGPVFEVGVIASAGTSAIPLSVTAERASALTGADLSAAPVAIVATPAPWRRTVVPLRRACGRYVDWYRLA